MSTPLTDTQEHAFRRAIGARAGHCIVMLDAGTHFARMPGERALVLNRSHALPGGREVRFSQRDSTIYASDVVA